MLDPMAARLVASCALLLSLSSPALAAGRLGAGADLACVRSLERALERGAARLRELADAPLRIRAVRVLYEPEPGGSSRVVILDTDRGEMVGKISYVRTVGSRMVPWILQDEASRAGVAPAIHKIVEGETLRALFREHPLLAGLPSPWPAYPDSPPMSLIVMEVVRDGFSFMQWERSKRSLDRYPPAALPLWTRRLREIEAYLNRCNVQVVDAQFLIQPDGNVAVIDLDHYTFTDAHGRRWVYNGVTDYPDLDYWKVPTPTEKLNDLTPSIQVLEALFAAPR